MPSALGPAFVGVLALAGTVAACAGSSGETDRPAPVTTAAPSSPSAAPSSPPPVDAGARDGGPHAASEALQRCAQSKGDIGSIADAVTRLNALAPHGDGACFVTTLPRPLAVMGSLNTASAQPAGGRGAPRLFFLLPKLVITAVPEGDGSKVLEFGEWIGTTRTLKGEVAVPVVAPLAADAPFTHVLQDASRTRCASCHRQEERHPTIPNAFLSIAFQPALSTVVTLSELEELHRLCTNAGDEGERCTMIHAVFDFGEVTQGSFTPVVQTM
ncbi:MAG: hypothetical protein JWP97_2812 [Labilithrix sp.]|nr:hypothetical protein [Labilithrix sp.]